MDNRNRLKVALLCSACAITSGASADEFNIPAGDLKSALGAYMAETGVQLMVSESSLRGVHTSGVKGSLTRDEALIRLLKGTGFSLRRDQSGAVGIVRTPQAINEPIQDFPVQLAQATPARAAVETVTVTSSKLGGADVQSIPIAITALSQEQLTATQTAGGPDLVKQVPNLTFTKTNFTGYSIQVRGIGTQAISVATDPAVAVAFNDTPFIRNHFFEQEFYDLSQVEVLRGPQGTLYGRNATAGVVNITSARPTDQFEAMVSADIGNYKTRRFEGMINLPIVSDRLDLRIAGEWTKRDGYSFNETTGEPIDGRDLWSGRVTLGWKPASSVQTDLIWEHFSGNDDRLRSGKQLCKRDPGPSEIDGVPVPPARNNAFTVSGSFFSQGCLPTSLYSNDAFQVVNGYTLPFVTGAAYLGYIEGALDPYASTTQSTNLRDIQSAINPVYRAKNDTVEYNAVWNATPTLAVYSDTAYNRDFLWSSEDYNRFDTSSGLFARSSADFISPAGVFCDPQLGCSDRLVVQDLAKENSWQFSQELRVASNLSGPLNFSAGGNYLHYETEENYYVFSNTFTMISLASDGGCRRPYIPSEVTGYECLFNGKSYNDPANGGGVPSEAPQYIDPNPLTNLDDKGHNYFLSQNPYVLNSYAVFGEAYYDVAPDLKLTGGLRWTDDQKHFAEIPSALVAAGYGYPSTGSVDQSWSKFTGRFVANWTPKLSFTDQTLVYGSFARGYKAGGANPPAAVLIDADVPKVGKTSVNIDFPVHPLTFKPEYINAFEVGTKNTAFDGAVTVNGDVFFYDYKGYQISQIVDRTAVNLNFDATVKGAEIEATWEPTPSLKFTLAGGYESTRIDNGQKAIDLIDRTAGHPGWVVMKPSAGQSSNCIFPDYVAAAIITGFTHYGLGNPGVAACGYAYYGEFDPLTGAPYVQNPTDSSALAFGADIPPGYPGFDPLSVDPNAPVDVNNGLGLPPNNGEGFAKDLSGNELPNAPHYTMSIGADYTLPVSPDWAATLHGDFYWQADSWARVFNDNPYDRIRGYTNLNLALILTDQSGWQVMGYVKNVFDTTAITGDFLNSDDSGLTTNVFLTDPRLFGMRVTKHFDSGTSSSTGFSLFSGDADGRPQAWLQLGGTLAQLGADKELFAPSFISLIPSSLPTGLSTDGAPGASLDWEGKLTLQPENSDWVLKAGIRYGRSTRYKHVHKSLPPPTKTAIIIPSYGSIPCTAISAYRTLYCPFRADGGEFTDAEARQTEQHMMIDFTLGKDVGLGLFGDESKGSISAGVRIAQLSSSSYSDINSDPNYNYDVVPKYHAIWDGAEQERRNFRGIGPEITWDASSPVLGSEEEGQITIDWGMNIAVLFGRQRVDAHYKTSEVICTDPTANSFCNFFTPVPPTNVNEKSIHRSRTVTVPDLGGYIGASMLYRNAKVSVGYRGDILFGAMDGGLDTARSYNRSFYGPYLNVSLGLGG